MTDQRQQGEERPDPAKVAERFAALDRREAIAEAVWLVLDELTDEERRAADNADRERDRLTKALREKWPEIAIPEPDPQEIDLRILRDKIERAIQERREELRDA